MARHGRDVALLASARARVRAEAPGARELPQVPVRKLLPYLVAVLRKACLTEGGEVPEYFGVYRRDAFRCSSPVCTRRDVTPHHLVFRSRGGGDEDENVASLCVWCH